MDDVRDRHERIVAYLLGTLNEPDQDLLEQQYFEDPAELDEIDSVEDNLFDAYAAGSLRGDRQRLFEQRFLSDTAGVERLQFARSLLRWTSEMAAKRSESLFSLLFSWFPSPMPVAAQESTTHEGKSLPFEVSSAEIVIGVPPTGMVEIVCDLFREPVFTNFELVLLTVDLAEVWRSAELQMKTVGSRQFLTAYLDAEMLKPGRYVLVLSANTPGGLREVFRRNLRIKPGSPS